MASASCAPQPNHRVHKLRVILSPRCYEKAYMAEGYEYFGQVAANLRPVIEASPLAGNHQLTALMEQLEVGNAVAERVLQATRR